MLTVIGTKDGLPGQPEPLGEIDREGFGHDRRSRATLGHKATRQLMVLLGNGYGDKPFDLQDGDTLMVGCRVVQVSAGSVLQFIKVQPAPDSQ